MKKTIHNRYFVNLVVCFKKGGEYMACIQCHDCKIDIHFTPIDVVEFTKRFVDGNEPVYCVSCWKKRESKEKK